MRRIIAVATVLVVSLAGALPAGAETEEGIRVHGHWKIEILEPDGTLVSVTEFENAFVGYNFITHTTTGGYSAGLWGIELDATAGSGPCHDGSFDASCWILDPVDPNSDPNVFPNLNIWIHSTDFRLEGSVVASFSTLIDLVGTQAGYCSSDVAPIDCLGSATAGGLRFTETVLGTPVAVDAGQIIQVTVTISFS